MGIQLVAPQHHVNSKQNFASCAFVIYQPLNLRPVLFSPNFLSAIANSTGDTGGSNLRK